MRKRGGRYLAEKPKHRNKKHKYYRKPSHYERRKWKRQRHFLILATIVAAVVFVLIAASIPRITQHHEDELSGAWLLADTTYTFDGHGSGDMDITSAKYSYSYTVEKDQLFIDFEEEIFHDCTYTFTIDGDTLTLVGGEGTAGGTYKLHR